MRQSTDDSTHHDPDLYNDMEKVWKMLGKAWRRIQTYSFFRSVMSHPFTLVHVYCLLHVLFVCKCICGLVLCIVDTLN